MIPVFRKIGEKYTPKRKKTPPFLQKFLLATGIRKCAQVPYHVLEKRGEIDTLKGVHNSSSKYTKYPREEGLNVDCFIKKLDNEVSPRASLLSINFCCLFSRRILKPLFSTRNFFTSGCHNSYQQKSTGEV